MNKQQALAKIEELKKFVEEIDKQAIQLYDNNFKVNSEGWKKKTVEGGVVLENPKGDIWEILGGEYNGEQLFTWDAAIRETKKAGKKMPTKEQFEELLKDDEFPKNRVLDGFRPYSSAALYDVGSYGYYWSSSVTGSYSCTLAFNSSSANMGNSGRANGFSVRCVRD